MPLALVWHLAYGKWGVCRHQPEACFLFGDRGCFRAAFQRFRSSEAAGSGRTFLDVFC